MVSVECYESPTLTGHNGSVSVSIGAAVAGSWSTLLHPLLVIIQGGTHIIPLAGHPDLLYSTLGLNDMRRLKRSIVLL